MGVNVTIDEKLVEEVKKLTGLSADSAAVEAALRRLVVESSKPPRKSMFDLVGKIQIRDGYDYKALRAGDDHAD